MSLAINVLDAFIDSRIDKVKGVNKPFKAIQKTDEYKKFETMYQEGIADQGKWAAENVDELLKSASISDDLTPLALDQTQRLKGVISRDMPKLADYVSEQKTFQLLRDFFEWSAIQQYKRWGYITKADAVDFTLTNEQYIQQLKDRAAYLLNQSSLDKTTLDQILSLIEESRLAGMTNGEVSQILSDQFPEISRSRSDMITRTESANSMGAANHATAKENGAQTKSWIAAGGSKDDLCAGNAEQGEIPIDQNFQSGNMHEPAHPNCECYTEAGLIDLDTIDLWNGA